jgi:ribosomal protein S5
MLTLATLCWRHSEGVVTVTSRVVRYQVGGTEVGFEVEAGSEWGDAGVSDLERQVRDAIEPAVEAAKVVLDRIKEARPDGVEVKFGVKVSGGANWVVARAAAEASFEITMTWRRDEKTAGQDLIPG